MVTFIYRGVREAISLALAERRFYDLERRGCECLIFRSGGKTEYYVFDVQ